MNRYYLTHFFILSMMALNGLFSTGHTTDHRRVSDYPIQPSFISENDALIEPLEMPAWNVGMSFNEKSWRGVRVAQSNNELLNYVRQGPIYRRFKWELPLHSQYKSFCLEYANTGFHTIIQEILGGYQFKYSFCNGLGSFAIGVAPKAGIVSVYFVQSRLMTGYTGVGFRCSGSLDWYFSQWVGCFLEVSYQYNILALQGTSYCQPYDYQKMHWVFGLKTTFFI